MAPKKAYAKLNSSPLKSPVKVGTRKNNADISEEQTKAVVQRKAPTHPSTMTMVKEALKELDSRKGASAHAIRNFIKEKHPTVDETKVQVMVRKALLKGLDSGAIVRPANSNANGAQGSFRIAKEVKAPKKTKEAKENTSPNVGKGTEKAKSEKAKSATTAGNKPQKTKEGVSASKVPPAKKPKAKQAAGEKSEPKAQKSSKASKSVEAETGKNASKKGKKQAQKSEEESDETEVVGPKKGKRAPVKAVDGGKEVVQKASDGNDNTAASKALGRKGKKVAEK